MDLEAIAVFLDVARRGSFASVARDRGVEPSTISRAVAALEADLTVRLFQRTTRILMLTEQGERFRDRVLPLMVEFERARDEATSSITDPVGLLRLTASVSFGQMMIVPLIPAFRAAFPRLTIELLLTDANLDLVEDRIDLAIRLAPTYGAGVIGAKLLDTRYRVVASPEYLAHSGPVETPTELSQRNCVLFSMPAFRTLWRFRRTGVVEDVPVSGNVIISSALALRSALLDGVGPGLVADFLVDTDLANGSLVDLLPEYDVTATSFNTAAWLLYPSGEYLPAKVRAAIDFIRRSMPER